jgi:hypothetical protein
MIIPENPKAVKEQYVPPRYGNTGYQPYATSTSWNATSVALSPYVVTSGILYTRPLPPIERKKNFFERLGDILDRL